MIHFCVFLIVTVFIPLPSRQHFIWPVDMCVLADLCNHTWIPECGLERDEEYNRLFLDECDMFEYNCDNKLNFFIVNYSDCFAHQGPCPPVKCPPTVACNNRRAHGNHDGLLYYRRSLGKPTLRTTPNLPEYMLHGKRRYTPNKQKISLPKDNLRKEDLPPHVLSILNNRINPVIRTDTRRVTEATWETKIIKTSTFFKNGMKVIKIFKSRRLAYLLTTKDMHADSDFLE